MPCSTRLVAGLVGAGCCILDYYVARNTAKIRVNDNSYVLAAQVRLLLRTHLVLQCALQEIIIPDASLVTTTAI